MDIDYSWDYSTVLKIYPLGVWTSQGEHVLIAANGLDNFSSNRYGLSDGVVLTYGEHFTGM